MKSELIEFIARTTHFKPSQIKPGTRLAEDIGFYGLDAIGFFEKFFDEFGIQNVDEFDVDLHIDDSVDFAPRPLNWIKNILVKERRKYLKPDVTMGHLETVIKIGKWINEK